MNAFICWTAGSGFFSHMIRRLDPGRYNHVLYRFRTATGLDLVYESLGKTGITLSPGQHLDAAIKDKRVYDYHERDLGLGDSGSIALWHSCTRMHGSGYDWRQIALYVGMLRWGWRRAPDRLNNPDRFTCNEFVVATGKDIIPEMDAADYRHTPEGLYRLFHGGASIPPSES